MADDEVEEIEEEWDEVIIEMRRFAVEQAIIMKGPTDTLADVFERADRIVDYIAQGTA